MGSIKLDLKTPNKAWFTDIVMILFFQLTFYLSPFVTIYAFFTLNSYLIVAIVFLIILQQKIGRCELFVRFVNKYIQPLKYFRRFLRIYDEQIDDDQNTMFCIHPHSEFSYGIASNINADNSKMSRAVGLASRFILSTPFIGLQLKLWGVQGVHKQNLKRLMKSKRDISLVPGGYQEATITSPDELRIYIKKRYGFIKYALRYGYTLRPTLIYNEHKAFKTFDHLTKFRLSLNKIKLPAVFFFGGYLQIFLPTSVEMITIVGRGIRRNPKNQRKPIKPQQIEQMHERYISEIKRLHEEYKNQFDESPLVIY